MGTSSQGDRLAGGERPSGTPSRKQRADRIAAAIFACFGAFWMIAALRQHFIVDTRYLSLSFLPFAAGAILTLLCGYLAIKPQEPDEESDTSSADGDLTAQWRAGAIRVALAFVALIVYAIALPNIHSLLTTFAIAVVGLALTGEPLRPRLFIIAAVIAAVLFAIFVMWLGVPLPGAEFS